MSDPVLTHYSDCRAYRVRTTLQLFVWNFQPICKHFVCVQLFPINATFKLNNVNELNLFSLKQRIHIFV